MAFQCGPGDHLLYAACFTAIACLTAFFKDIVTPLAANTVVPADDLVVHYQPAAYTGTHNHPEHYFSAVVILAGTHQRFCQRKTVRVVGQLAGHA
ncbi:hypothetical protein D3C87_1984560 [compost metagenome]